MAHLPPEKNKESLWLDREDDFQALTRNYWRIAACPCADKCSRQAWSKVYPWSYEGGDEAKRYVKHHLMYSGNHSMSAAGADEILD